METRYYYIVDIFNTYCVEREVFEEDFADLPLDFEEGQALIRVEGPENERADFP